MLLILGRSGTQYVAMVTKLLSSYCAAPFSRTLLQTSETISDSAECYAGLLVQFESSPACI